MNTDPKQINRIKAVGIIIVGILLIALSLDNIFKMIGIILVLITIPSLTESYKLLGEKNRYAAIVFIKSFLVAVVSVLLFFKPSIRYILCSIIAGIILLSLIIEIILSDDRKDYIKKEFPLIIVSALLFCFGFLIDNILDIFRYVVGGSFIVCGIIMFLTNKTEKPDVNKILEEYEERYQAEHPEGEAEVVDSTAEEVEDNNPESDDDNITRFN